MSYNYTNYTNYKARCTLAEKLADIQLRKWCVERLGVLQENTSLDFTEVDALFTYVKERKMVAND